jgi:hypothetical protein
MGLWWLVPVALLLIVLVALWISRPLHTLGRAVQVERARELFMLQRERIEAEFLPAAAASGKPRGLHWKKCSFESHLELAREKETGRLVALVPVTIQFEAVEGSDMEGLPAVGNLRSASAVFFFQRGQWKTYGKAVFNLSPQEAIAHFHNQYERVASG